MLPQQSALLDVLTRFARTLADRFDIGDVLYNLTDSTIEVLGATAAGVSLTDTDSLQFVSANSEVAVELEKVQQDSAQGPCHQAFMTGIAVVVDDISVHDEWPLYRAAALDGGVHAVMGIPLIIGDTPVGALNVDHDEIRAWTSDEVRSAQVHTDIATSYLLDSSRLDEAQRVNEQLQRALDTRVVIEQAKGVLAGEHGIGLDAAFETIRGHARSKQVDIRSIAHAVAEIGLRLPAPARDVGAG